MPEANARGRAGAARRARTDARLAESVTEQLASVGYAGLTIEGVASVSGVAKTTIYRRWQSKAEMVFDLVIHRADQTELDDTGSLVGDVNALARRAVVLVAREPGRRVLPGLLADMAGDPALRERLDEDFIAPARSDIEAMFDRASDRGELPREVDVEGFHAALLGLPYARVHLLGDVDEQGLAEALADQLLALLGVREA